MAYFRFSSTGGEMPESVTFTVGYNFTLNPSIKGSPQPTIHGGNDLTIPTLGYKYADIPSKSGHTSSVGFGTNIDISNVETIVISGHQYKSSGYNAHYNNGTEGPYYYGGVSDTITITLHN